MSCCLLRFRGAEGTEEKIWSKLIGAEGARENFSSAEGLEESLAQWFRKGGVEWCVGGGPAVVGGVGTPPPPPRGAELSKGALASRRCLHQHSPDPRRAHQTIYAVHTTHSVAHLLLLPRVPVCGLLCKPPPQKQDRWYYFWVSSGWAPGGGATFGGGVLHLGQSILLPHCIFTPSDIKLQLSPNYTSYQMSKSSGTRQLLTQMHNVKLGMLLKRHLCPCPRSKENKSPSPSPPRRNAGLLHVCAGGRQ